MRKLCPCVQTQCTHSFTRSYSLRHKHKYTFGMQNQQHEHLCLSCAHVRIHRVLIIVLVSLGRPGCTPISNSAQIYQIIFLLIYGMGSSVGHPLTRRKAGEHFFCNNFHFLRIFFRKCLLCIIRLVCQVWCGSFFRCRMPCMRFLDRNILPSHFM